MMLEGIGSYSLLERPGNASSAAYQKAPPRFLQTLDGLDQAPAAPANTTYTVKSGDNLAAIVRNHLQASGMTADNVAVFGGVREVAKANGIPNPDRIHPGQNIDLGVLGGAPAPTASLTAPALQDIDVGSLPPLPKARTNDAKVETRPLPVPASSEAEPEAPTSSVGSGGGLNSRIGPMASFASHRGLMMSPGPQGGPSHPLRGGLLAELAPEVHYPVKSSGGHRDLNQLIDRLLNPGAEEETASVSAAVPDATGMPWERAVAAKTRITSRFGARRDPFTRRADFHAGLDLAAPSGSDIHPVQPGTVTFSGWKSGYGRVIFVDHGDGIESVYGHNSKNLVAVGQKVDETTVLGLVGSSGRSTGPHLHLEIRRDGKAIDPVKFLGDPTKLAKN